MNSKQLLDYFQARINLQLALFFKAIKEDNEQEKEKIKAEKALRKAEKKRLKAERKKACLEDPERKACKEGKPI